jgi:phosphoribosyl-AMP cyclohydrolase / phosphoribosyl-ATP pyrophosphohydrolase
MIVPSIDLMKGQSVQLVGGKDFELSAGDPRPLANQFSLVGEIAVVDLDAALRQGTNAETIRELLTLARCRVGGGIRTVEAARQWLDAGAVSVVLGTAAQPKILRQLPRERVIAALDARNDEVVVDGWRKGTGMTVLERIKELRDLVGGFLVTFVEREGRLGGTRLDAAEQIAAAAGDARVTIAGGVTTAEEVAALDAMGCDAQVGMALYKGHLSLADAFAAPLVSDRPDGLWPTVVADEDDVALGLAYSSRESLRAAIETRRGVYHSRARGIWIKGESSGATQELLEVAADCDRDALRFRVRQTGDGFCHRHTRTCWGAAKGAPELVRRLKARMDEAPNGSYTRRLLDDPALLNSKLAEEARELAEANGVDETIAETADVLYFALVKLVASGASWEQVSRELDRRQLKITRRPGDAKPAS